MNPFLALAIEILLTLLVCATTTRYLSPYLKRILGDLCRTEERAQFWAAFSNILLVGLPLIISLGFQPEAGTLEQAVFEILGRMSGNLAGYLFALAGIGIIVSIFALVAPRPSVESK